MIDSLAQAAKELREEADRKIIHIAVMADLDPSTIWRFEHGQWPREPERVIAAYATDLEIDARDIWLRALDLWTPDENQPAEPV